MAQRDRNRNLVVRLTDDELDALRRLAEARDEPMTATVRRLVRAAVMEMERFGSPSVPTKERRLIRRA